MRDFVQAGERTSFPVSKLRKIRLVLRGVKKCMIR